MSTNKPVRFKEIHFSCSAHMTEDIHKVRTAMKNLLPEDLREKKALTETFIKGHAGNEIKLLEITISQSKERKAVVAFLAKHMEDFDKSYLYEQLDIRLDDSNCFYFRFNKQDAFNEKLTIDDKDNTIRVMLKFIVYKSEPGLVENLLEEYGLVKK